MADPTVTDLRRELEKVRDALAAAEQHLARHAEMNAALHCADRVMYSPLHAKVTAAITGIDHALTRTDHAQGSTPATPAARAGDRLAKILTDLDRCQHGRHQGDDCGSCGGVSNGNHHLRPGAVIGYGRYGDQIVMPSRDKKHDPAAWRPTTTEEPTR